MMLRTDEIVLSDVLGHMLVLLTFGLCSPFLSASILLTVFWSQKMWVMVLGRFVHDHLGLASVSCGDNTSVALRCNNDSALLTLSHACLPILFLVSEFVWPMMWSSASFFAFLCWDVVGDEAGMVAAVWAPALVLSISLCLWMCERGIVFYVKLKNERAKRGEVAG